MDEFNYDQVLLHAGSFNADDVFTVALCRLLNPKIQIIASNNFNRDLKYASNINKKVLVLDPECTTYFPMLWSKHGQLLCKDLRAYREIRVEFANKISIQPLTTNIPNFLASSIEALNIKTNIMETDNISFHRAMNIAIILLQAQINLANSKIINV